MTLHIKAIINIMKEKISSASPKYIDTKKGQKEHVLGTNTDNVIGGAPLTYIDAMTGDGDLEKLLPDDRTMINNDLRRIKGKILQRFYENPEQTRKAFQDRGIELERLGINGSDISRFDSMDDETLLALLREYREGFIKGKKAFEAKKEKLASVAKNGVMSWIAENEDINIQEVKSRLDFVSIEAQDTFSGEYEPGYYGLFDPHGSIVYVDISLSDESIEEVLTHEFLHVASGRTSVFESKRLSMGDTVENVKDIRSGLKLYNRFDWLNEAVTELLTSYSMREVRSSDKRTTNTYVAERDLLEALRTLGKKEIGEKVVLDAYFEDFEPSDVVRIPKWKRFAKEVNEAFVPGFLTKLDVYTRKYGIDKALEAMKSDWKVIAEYEPPKKGTREYAIDKILRGLFGKS
jgi:hypothetical protein